MAESKYEQLVRQRAEEFAKEWENNNIQHTDDQYLEGIVKECMPLARLSIQREAEAVRDAIDWTKDQYDAPEAVKEMGIKEYLQSLGLVPENDKP